MNTRQKAEIAQLKVELRAAEKGWITSRTNEGSRYDVVLDDGKKLFRVQVKYGGYEGGHATGAVIVDLRKYQGDDRNRQVKRSKRKLYSKSEIDCLLVYLPQVDKVCWIKADMFDSKTEVTLRFKPPKNGQKKGVNLVEDFVW